MVCLNLSSIIEPILDFYGHCLGICWDLLSMWFLRPYNPLILDTAIVRKQAPPKLVFFVPCCSVKWLGAVELYHLALIH